MLKNKILKTILKDTKKHTSQQNKLMTRVMRLRKPYKMHIKINYKT